MSGLYFVAGLIGLGVVCTKLKEMLIIQCKYWAEDKLIHEKHIFQLFGTMTLAKLDNPLSDVKGVFVTSTTLSDAAKRIADFLGIEVKESIALGEFPRIKCNINNGERVYHLPFDQQYDTTKIENVGEFYAFTVLEAEQKGFRRACRHLNY